MRSISALLCLTLVNCGPDDGSPPADSTPEDTLADVPDAADTTDTVDPGDTLIRPEVDAAEVVQPLDAPPGVWTWFDQPGSACSDGSETGFAVNPGTSDKVLVVMMGGGACWDFNTCFVFATAAKGPFRKAQFDAGAADAGVLDRDDVDNPFRDFSFVFVPYCTGDLHAGERVMSYTEGGLTNTWHHMGAVNVRLMLPRLAATFPSPELLVVAGLSAGGFGATLQYAAFRAALAPGASQLVDDSGPLLVGDAIPAAFRSAWFVNWRLDLVVDTICGQDCKSDLSAYYPHLAARFPNDRMALVSSLQDQVIATYFLQTGPELETAIRKLATDVLAPLANWRTFLFAGSTHTTLASPEAFSSDGQDLRGWLALMASGDPGWPSLGN